MPVGPEAEKPTSRNVTYGHEDYAEVQVLASRISENLTSQRFPQVLHRVKRVSTNLQARAWRAWSLPESQLRSTSEACSVLRRASASQNAGSGFEGLPPLELPRLAPGERGSAGPRGPKSGSPACASFARMVRGPLTVGARRHTRPLEPCRRTNMSARPAGISGRRSSASPRTR